MKKKLCIVLLAVLLTFLCALPAVAEPVTEDYVPEETTVTQPAEETTAPAEDSIVYATDEELYAVTDLYGLISEDDAQALISAADAAGQKYGCGIYIVIVDDFTEYWTGSDIRDFAEYLYGEYDLGWGSDDSGVLLMLSMWDRDYALIAHGDFGNAAVTDYGRSVLENAFLDDFANDNWMDGFTDYQSTCIQLFSAYTEGTPVDVDNTYDNYDSAYTESSSSSSSGSFTDTLPMAILIGLVVGFLWAMGLRKQMKSVHTAASAAEYAVGNGVQLNGHMDQFTHITQTRIKIKDSSSHGGGGTTINSGGFSGSRGKF